MRRRRLSGPILVLALGALAPSAARAQAGMGTDIITGVVTGQTGPIQDAVVEAFSLETEVTRRARTDTRGRFTILFPDGGGQYRMTARAVGLSPRIGLLVRDADEDRLEWNVQLRGGGVTLEAVTVRAAPLIAATAERPAPGSSERVFSTEQVARLPLDVADLALLASLVPGVLSIPGTDTTATAFSVAGLGPDANAVTLDGLLFGSSSVPQEGLRQTRVVTSVYDVSRGQFSGGLVASTTRSGSNRVQGSSGFQLRDDDLALGGEDSPYARGFTQHVISGGIGGPLARDRLFAFGSFQARLRSDPQQTLLSATAEDLARLGVAPDSVARFLDAVDALGVPHASVPGGATRANDNLSGMLRLDAVVTNSHSLTLRGDWRGSSQEPSRLGPLSLPQAGGTLESEGGGMMATLTSRFGAAVLNEFRGYAQWSRRDGSPYTALPQGRVQVVSELDDGTRSVTTLVFGGGSTARSRSRSSSFEASDELSWMPGAGRHRFKLGGYYLLEGGRDQPGANLLGTFTYNSLADLGAGTPSSFRRTLEMAERESEGRRWGAFLGDVWMVSRPFQLTYGVRFEGSSFGAAPPYNPDVGRVFDRRTDRLPKETRLSPRAGFTWTLGGSRPAPGSGRMPAPAAFVIRGGVGEFRSQPPTALAAQARAATGLDLSSAEIYCVGAAVPVPAWDGYRADPSTVPDECLIAGPAPPGGGQASRTVTLLADDLEAPRAWRGSLSVERRLTQLFRLTVDASVSRGVAQSGFRDLNLDAAPGFTLAVEDGRPVFVAPGDVTPLTGVPRFAASRVDSTFGHVLEATSDLASRSVQLTVGLGGVFGRGLVLQTSYTWQRARDLATGVRGGSTAADPNAAEWARSDLERRHSFLATVTYPLGRWVEVTGIGRLSSGTPYTPLVGGDVNGDGLRNDRAFVFAAGAGASEAEGMARLLAQASPAVRECLENQAGRVASRNSCTGPWQTSLDFQLNWRPRFLGLGGRLSVSLVTVNFLRGLDELLHGADGARGWGLMTRPDGTLLYVTGFDPVQRAYSYEVNERFGQTRGSATAYRPPFQVGFQARLTIGPDRGRAALDAMRMGGGPGGFGGGMGPGMGGRPGEGGGPGVMAGLRDALGSPDAMLARLDSALPNPAAVALEMRDSLGLDSAQMVLLRPIRDSLDARRRVRLDSLRAIIERAGSNPAPMRLLPQVRPVFEAARGEAGQATVSVRAILSEEQWARLPAAVRNYQSGPPRPMRPPQ